MNKDKNKPNISTIILELENLISDWRKVESPEVTDIAEEIIIDKAAELLEVARPQKLETTCGKFEFCVTSDGGMAFSAPKKSEMACNCPHDCDDEELPKEFIDAMKSVTKILGQMTETQKDALTAKICSDMHFDILQAVRKTFGD